MCRDKCRIEMIPAAVLFIFLAVSLASEAPHWKYGETGYGPHDWKKIAANCSGSAQSPINIESSTPEPSLKGLKFTGDNKKGKVSGNLTNTGHAPQLDIDKSKGTATLTGGPLGESVYKLEQFHFHFGCRDDKGSEHTVNGTAFSGELHLVTYNTEHTDFNNAADKPDGLSVIGVFLKVKKNDGYDLGDRAWIRLSKKMRQIKEEGAVVAINNLSLYQLVPALKDLSTTPFFSYEGSLTTPPCYESVSWIVLKRPIAVHKTVFKAMRNLRNREEHSYCNNFRPTQPLNERTVFVTE